MKEIIREIEVVENMIKLLKECLAISLSNKRKEEAKRTIQDIKLCETELQKLLLKKREKVKDAVV
jgi:hypothetical protein